MRVAAAVVAGSVLVGCTAGGGDGASSRTSVPTGTTTAATSVPAPSPTSATASSAATRNRALDRPLIRAAYRNDVARASRLIAGGADVNRKDSTEQSAYLIATSEVGDDPRLLDLTLAAGADVHSLDSFNGTGLIRAADRGYPAIVRRLLRTEIRVDHVNNLGWTALHEAVILGDGSRDYVRVVRLLVEAGADVNKPSRRDGIRPLQHATTLGFTEVARVLRAAGAR
ncbi:MAG TPA: ankyrin repeat domain-containing protein [Actinomycetes bacterium]